MATRGPKPMPRAILEARRSAKLRHPIRRDFVEPEPPKGEPRRPEGQSPEWYERWDRACSEIESLGILAETDGAMLAGYVTSWLELERLSRKLEGHTAIDFQYSRYQKAWLAHWRVVKEAASCFGLTPSDRVHVGRPKGLEADDELTAWKRAAERKAAGGD